MVNKTIDNYDPYKVDELLRNKIYIYITGLYKYLGTNGILKTLLITKS